MVEANIPKGLFGALFSRTTVVGTAWKGWECGTHGRQSPPLLPPTIAPSQSLVILVPENFLLQLCGSTRIVTHSPPQAILVLGSPLSPPFPPTSFSLACSVCTLSSAPGKAPGECSQLFWSFCIWGLVPRLSVVLLALVDGESMTGVQSNRTCSDLSLGTTGWAQGSSNSIIQAPSVLSSPPLEWDSLMAFRLIFFLAPFFKALSCRTM